MPNEVSQNSGNKGKVTRNDWILVATEVLRESGIGSIKVVVLAKRMGVTSGSFYWHFKKLSELQDAVLEHWDHRLTEHIIQDAIDFDGTGEQRIYNLMRQVIIERAAELDNAISIWAKTSEQTRMTFNRTLNRRFEFAAWMFEKVGFPANQAKIRGRLMVAYLMGESSSNLLLQDEWEEILKQQLEVLVAGKP